MAEFCTKATLCVITPDERLYHERLVALLAALQPLVPQATRAALAYHCAAGGMPGYRIAQEALAFGMAPTPLSVWYQDEGRRLWAGMSVPNMPREGLRRVRRAESVSGNSVNPPGEGQEASSGFFR